MWNTREPIWMGTERGNMNETRLYLMLHMTMSQVCWHADLQSMYRLCKSLYTAGFAQGTNTHFLSQRRDLCSNLEIIQGPAERPRIMKRQPKTQEDTSPKNILRSVHRLSLGPHIRAWSLGAYRSRTEKVLNR
jgi:hypothetical protein